MYTITRAALRGEVTPVPIKEGREQLHIHPRMKRDLECPCGYPRSPCTLGKKFKEGEEGWKQNFCAKEDLPG